jgi:hypothetical protein
MPALTPPTHRLALSSEFFCSYHKFSYQIHYSNVLHISIVDFFEPIRIPADRLFKTVFLRPLMGTDKTDLFEILYWGFIREIVYPFRFPLKFDRCKTLYAETCMHFCDDFQRRPTVIPREKHEKVDLGQPINCPGKRQVVMTSRLLVQ